MELHILGVWQNGHTDLFNHHSSKFSVRLPEDIR